MGSTKHDLEGDLEGEAFASDESIATNEGWISRKMRWIGRRDAPDRFLARKHEKPCKCCGARGRVVLVETKRLGVKARITQQREHDRLRAHGVEVLVIDNIRDAKKLLRGKT